MDSGTIGRHVGGTAYVPGFAYDVFVSFAHLDNRRFGPRPPWVTWFVRDLDTCIRMQLGTRKELAIFFDSRGGVESGTPLATELARSAGSAATFLAVTSPAYVDKDSWALDELRAFEDSRRTDQRIFPIELLPVDGADGYPSALRDLMRFNFWTENRERIPVPIPPRSQALCQRLLTLSNQMARHLKQMRDARMPLAA